MLRLLFSVLILSILFISCQNSTTTYDTHNDAVNKMNSKIQIDSVFNVADWQFDKGYRLSLKFMSGKITKYSLWHTDKAGFYEQYTHTYYISIYTRTKIINSVWLP